jgi:predicted RNA-binding protein YlqC (UPF0109 family)
MKDVLEFILKNITTVPDDVKIEEKEDESGTNYVISVNSADVGRIIGKEGKVIKAIRTIMRVIAIQKGVHVRVSVLSDEVTTEASVEAAPVVEESVDVSAELPQEELTVEV